MSININLKDNKKNVIKPKKYRLVLKLIKIIKVEYKKINIIRLLKKNNLFSLKIWK